MILNAIKYSIIFKLQQKLHSHFDFLHAFWKKIHSPILHLTIKCFVLKQKLQIEYSEEKPVIPIILLFNLLKNDLFEFIFEIRFIKIKTFYLYDLVK